MSSIDAFIPRESDLLFVLADEYEEQQKIVEAFLEEEYILNKEYD
jgi:hypothetical protein